MFNKKIKSWMSIFGCFGFLGILGFILNIPVFLTLFVLFSFFGCYWKGKVNKEKVDERLRSNFFKAQKYGYRAGMVMTFLAAIVSLRIFRDYNLTLMIQTTLICLAISLTNILIPMLTYYFDRGNFSD